MNEIAKAHWDLAMQWIKHADDADDVNTTICYTSMAEFALKAAQFAVDHPMLVGGAAEAGIPYAIPEGAVQGDEGVPVPGPNTPAPQAPSGGPKFWGAPQ